MTNTNTTTRPVVKSTNPELYVQHTFHMKRARKYTYNYSVIDDYIVANWKTSSFRVMSEELNELQNRIEYRVQVLKTHGLIEGKNNMERGKLMRQRKHLVTWLKEIDSKLEGVA
jgi:hypothetical protein